MSAATTTLQHLLPRACVYCLYVLLSAACATVDIGGPRSSKNNPAAGKLELPSGKSIAVLPDELNYSGEATYTWPDGRTRSGMWLDGKLHGMGTERYRGEYYSGQWHHGERHGHGELESADDGRYVGLVSTMEILDALSA